MEEQHYKKLISELAEILDEHQLLITDLLEEREPSDATAEITSQFERIKRKTHDVQIQLKWIVRH